MMISYCKTSLFHKHQIFANFGTAHHHKCNWRDLICNWKICQIKMQRIFYIRKIVKLRNSKNSCVLQYFFQCYKSTNQLLQKNLLFSHSKFHLILSVSLHQGAYNSGKMEISENFLILENSGNLKCTQGIFVYQTLLFATQSETHNKPTCKFACLHAGAPAGGRKGRTCVQ